MHVFFVFFFFFFFFLLETAKIKIKKKKIFFFRVNFIYFFFFLKISQRTKNNGHFNIKIFFFFLYLILPYLKKKKKKANMKRTLEQKQYELKKPQNGDVIDGSKYIHINSIPYEILGIIMNECEEYSFVSQFICKHWKETYKYLIQPEWNKEIQKREGRKQRITWKHKIPLSFLQWVVDDVKGKYKFTQLSMNRAALFGDLEMIKWLREQRVPCDKDACDYAAQGGHLEVLKWLREQEAPLGEWTSVHAAKGGHLEILKWAREQGCGLNQWTYAYAAKQGHLEILKWLREQGCYCDEWEETCVFAAKEGHLEVLKWIEKQGIYWKYITCGLKNIKKTGVHRCVVKNGKRELETISCFSSY
jgi:hypothetical protein